MANERKQLERFIPQLGERAFIAGQTGSGKTAFSLFLMERVPVSPIIIMDTKEEQKFIQLPHSKLATTIQDMDAAVQSQEFDYVIMRPPAIISGDPNALDDILWYIYMNYRNVCVDIDEAYQFHNNGRAGRGLIALMTRGRSRGLTVLMCTQRPAWISKFMITEAQKFYLFFLQTREDKKRLNDIIPDFDLLPDPPLHGFYFFRSGEREATKYGAIKLAKTQNLGYVDSDPIAPASAPVPRKRATIWID